MARAGGSGELAQARLDARQDLGHRHRGHPRRRQLDPQRQPVEAGAELGHHRLVVLVQDEVRPPRPGPLDEQATRILGLQRVDRPDRLAADVERLPAGGHDPEIGRTGRAAPPPARRTSPTTCSQLSRTRRTSRASRWRHTASTAAVPPGVRTPNVRAVSAGHVRPSAARPPGRPASRHRPAAGPAAPPAPGPTGSCPRRRVRSGSATGSGPTPPASAPTSRSRPISGRRRAPGTPTGRRPWPHATWWPRQWRRAPPAPPGREEPAPSGTGSDLHLLVGLRGFEPPAS